MGNTKRKTTIWRGRVKCLLCLKELNSDNEKKHKEKVHNSDPMCKFAIVSSNKQLNLTEIASNVVTTTSSACNKGT